MKAATIEDGANGRRPEIFYSNSVPEGAKQRKDCHLWFRKLFKMVWK
jgi:hypothetical protein|tara:strand:- start:1455 stop:1595 length:141 start_codon:yes stop_codon:yes gene_type:complete